MKFHFLKLHAFERKKTQKQTTYTPGSHGHFPGKKMLPGYSSSTKMKYTLVIYIGCFAIWQI